MNPWRKKGSEVLVSAIRVNEDNAKEVADWCRAQIVEEIDAHYPGETQPGLNVRTPAGMDRASLSDYVVHHGNNFFVVKASAFEEDYEPYNEVNQVSHDTRNMLGFGTPKPGFPRTKGAW